MKYNIANPTTGQQIQREVDDDKINRHFSDRRMGSDLMEMFWEKSSRVTL